MTGSVMIVRGRGSGTGRSIAVTRDDLPAITPMSQSRRWKILGNLSQSGHLSPLSPLPSVQQLCLIIIFLPRPCAPISRPCVVSRRVAFRAGPDQSPTPLTPQVSSTPRSTRPATTHGTSPCVRRSTSTPLSSSASPSPASPPDTRTSTLPSSERTPRESTLVSSTRATPVSWRVSRSRRGQRRRGSRGSRSTLRSRTTAR